jgi:rhodanese-related sulfurtransferase
MTILLAAFDDKHAAQLAVHQLAQAGVARDDIRIEHNLERLRQPAAKAPRESVLGSLGRTFGDLVRANIDHHQVDLVTEVVERGATVLVARTAGGTQADRAAQLLREAGAFNVSVQAGAARAG